MMEMLSRWQFGVTITYHFLFVPLTIGLALLVAVMQVLAYRTAGTTWDRLARFFGDAVSHQLRHGHRDRHRPGVPVRHELVGLLGVRGQHLRRAAGLRRAARVLRSSPRSSGCGCSAATGFPRWRIAIHLPGQPGHRRVCVLHPDRQRLDAAPGRLPHHRAGKAELTDFWAVLGNSTLWAEFSHTVLAAFVTGSMFVLGVSAWQLLRGGEARSVHPVRPAVGRRGAGLHGPGDRHRRHPGQVMTTQQPMKMAAAEAVYKTQ